MYGLDDKAKGELQKHLRTADEFFRAKRYNDALAEIEAALRMDPRNPLARSFQEKIRLAQKQFTTSEPSASPQLNTLSPEEGIRLLPQLFREIDQFMAKKDYHRALEKIKNVFVIDPSNVYAKAYQDKIEELKVQDSEERQTSLQSDAAATASLPALPKGSLSMYRELLKEFWFDGKISTEEAAELKHVRDLFGISMTEHQQIERDVKVESYVSALRIAWKDGVVTENEQKILEMLRQRYSISSEEHLSAESKIDEARRVSKSNGTILVVDSDHENVVSLVEILSKRNYEALAAQSIKVALDILVHRTPDLILCDMLFPTKGTDGFSLYQKLQEHPTLKNLPFFFMSSVGDAKVMRAGIRLGVDAAFSKPLDLKLVIAEIDGRLHAKK